MLDRSEVAEEPLTEEEQVEQILYWIGFIDDDKREAIRDDALRDYKDLENLTEKEIDTLSDSFQKKMSTDGKMTFGSRRTRYLKAASHWTRDFARISKVPTIIGLNKSKMLEALNVALDREKVRKNLMSTSELNAKAASPGPLDSEKKWLEWEPKFVNYLSTMFGINGVPLSYVIRENDVPDHDGEHADFMQESIACAPLEGTPYEADRATVFQLLISFTTGHPSEAWIKPTVRKRNGRLSMKALRDHFSGEGNATCRIAEADRLKESLFYKSERSLSFETFLTKCQKMFNIYEKEKEPMEEDAKIRFLFKKVNHPSL